MFPEERLPELLMLPEDLEEGPYVLEVPELR
jgi:hypothetical protein